MSDVSRDDFGGEAVLHIEVDGDPVHFGHPDGPTKGNIGISPTTQTTEFDVDGNHVTIDCVAFVDAAGGGGV